MTGSETPVSEPTGLPTAAAYYCPGQPDDYHPIDPDLAGGWKLALILALLLRRNNLVIQLESWYFLRLPPASSTPKRSHACF